MKIDKSILLSLLILTINLNALEDKNNAYILYLPNQADTNAIEIAIKDNIDLLDHPTTAGSYAMLDNIADKDAFLVTRLKEAGYWINGKTNLSEWANFRSEKSISGWSSYGGQTLNPYRENLNPCGSSSGSAVAVASGLVQISIGTETNGSISCPSSVNGIVGFKPTVGIVSRSGIIPISKTQDTAGPMGKTVRIVAETLEAIAGPDPEDPTTLMSPENFSYDFTSDLDKEGISGKRLGLLKSGEEFDEAKKLLKRISNHVEKLGGTVIEIDDDREYPGKEEYFLLLYEFKLGLEEYLSKSNSSLKTIESLIDFHKDNSEIMMPYFEHEIFEKSIATANKIEEYENALKMVEKVRAEFNQLLDKYNLDGFIGLTRNPAWEIDYEGGDDAAMSKQMGFGNGAYAAIAGYPHLTLPLATIDDLPVGVSLIGKAWSDAEILKMGYDLEKNRDLF
mgnify:CR=1 FL=1|tara:strand:+ start:3698 stop:5050 length:1353 start_codon:yes stop_codon:yes gene_type:complete